MTVLKWAVSDESAGSNADSEARPLENNYLAESADWTSSEGSTITAAIRSVDAKGYVYFVKSDGSILTVHGSKLDADSLARVKTLVK